jgi:hypothetical protein
MLEPFLACLRTTNTHPAGNVQLRRRFDVQMVQNCLRCGIAQFDLRAPNGALPLAKIAIGSVRSDYSAKVVQHADLCPVRARERAVLRVRDRVTDRVWPCIPDRAVSKPIVD